MQHKLNARKKEAEEKRVAAEARARSKAEAAADRAESITAGSYSADSTGDFHVPQPHTIPTPKSSDLSCFLVIESTAVLRLATALHVWDAPARSNRDSLP